MVTAAPRRTWRKVDLQAIARDQPIRERLHWLWLGESSTLFCCLFAVSMVALGYIVSSSRQLGPDFPLLMLCYMLLGFVGIVYVLVQRTRQRSTTTAIAPKSGPGRAVIAVVVVELSLIVVLALVGREPLPGHLQFLVLLLCVNTLIAVAIRTATERLRARLLADPEVPRILAENAAQIRSGVHATTRAPRISAWTEAQRASPHQDVAAARRARLMKRLWSIPLALGFLLAVLLKGVPYLRIDFNVIPFAAFMWAFVGLVGLGFVGNFLYDRAERRRTALAAEIKVQAAPSAQYALQKDHRPAILLLRSFADDVARNGGQRFEESIAPWLTRYGPLVAIGDPKDAVPDLGAYRDYVAEENWQDRARAINAAAVIVMIPVDRIGSNGSCHRFSPAIFCTRPRSCFRRDCLSPRRPTGLPRRGRRSTNTTSSSRSKPLIWPRRSSCTSSIGTRSLASPTMHLWAHRNILTTGPSLRFSRIGEQRPPGGRATSGLLRAAHPVRLLAERLVRGQISATDRKDMSPVLAAAREASSMEVAD